MNKEIKKLKNLLFSSENIVAFTGAGVSTESNIPDFRSSGGIFDKNTNSNYQPETILSKSFFELHPDIFYNFYKNNLIYENAVPNYCHIALAELERKGILKNIITQNVDCLHQRAGSKNVIELHGNAYNYYCTNCNKTFNLNFIQSSKNVPLCDRCNHVIRPDIVLYEEPLDSKKLDKADYVSQNADILLVLGTSLVVYPAASFVKNYKGKNLVIINKSFTPYDYKATMVINDSVGTVMNLALARQ